MKNLNEYLKYYWLENYLFKNVHDNFHKNGYLNAEEFFAIIIWKRAASKTKIKDSFIKSGKKIEDLTAGIFKNKGDRNRQLELLTDLDHVGISIASAILTVCYPNDFTIVDVRACASLKRPPFGISIFPYEKFILKSPESKKLYLKYVDECKVLAEKQGIPLRDFDRVLFAMDLYNEEKTGLYELINKYNEREKEPEKIT